MTDPMVVLGRLDLDARRLFIAINVRHDRQRPRAHRVGLLTGRCTRRGDVGHARDGRAQCPTTLATCRPRHAVEPGSRDLDDAGVSHMFAWSV